MLLEAVAHRIVRAARRFATVSSRRCDSHVLRTGVRTFDRLLKSLR
jgi:hypothetical protein